MIRTVLMQLTVLIAGLVMNQSMRNVTYRVIANRTESATVLDVVYHQGCQKSQHAVRTKTAVRGIIAMYAPESVG